MPDAVTLEEVQQSTGEDRMLMSFAEDMQKGKLRGDMQQTEYKAVFGELTWTKGVLLKGTQLVLPKTLWAEVIALAHGGHQHCQAGPCLPGRGKGSQAGDHAVAPQLQKHTPPINQEDPQRVDDK